MKPYEATETAYKNGYKQGNADAMKWISVKERLPEDTLPRFSEVKQIKVLTALKSNGGVVTVRTQMRYRDTWCNEVRWRWKYSGSEVTHWMPLPEPPKGE